MLRGILPKEYSFNDFFEKHISITSRIAVELLELTSGNGDINSKFEIIDRLEHEADDVTHECTDALYKTFITPFERIDIHNLMKRLDDIADLIDGTVSRMITYDIRAMRPEARELAEILFKLTGQIEIALKGLRNMNKTESVTEACKMIHNLESEGDDVLRSAISRLFKESDAVTIIKWKEIFERLEKAIDRSEAVANIIEGIVITAA
jgi:uncharacterized protein Yka (UPF0111/DUF47 family)